MTLPTIGVPLTPPRRGILSRLPLVPRLFPGAAVTRGQVDPYAARWLTSNERDYPLAGPLWVVLGDSTAQGIGAPRHDRGYVGQLRAVLETETGSSWRVLNLSRSGDRVEDVLANQLPVLGLLAEAPRLVTCVAGGNDLLHTPLLRLADEMTRLMDGLPEGAVIGTLPQGMRTAKAVEINALIVARAHAAGLRVADIWTASGPPWRGNIAVDQFHPNDRGYAKWANAIAEAAGLDRRVEVPEMQDAAARQPDAIDPEPPIPPSR